MIQEAVTGSLDFDKMTGVLGQVAGQMAGQMAGMRTNSSIRLKICMQPFGLLTCCVGDAKLF